MEDVFQIVFGTPAATPFVPETEWCGYQQRLRELGELRRVCKEWNVTILPHCLRTIWFTYPSQTFFFLETWKDRPEICLVRHLRFDWGIPGTGRIGVVRYAAPLFRGWKHRKLESSEYCRIPRWYDAEDTTTYEALNTLCNDTLVLFPQLISIDTGYTGRGLSRTVIQLPTFYSTLVATRGQQIPLQTLRGVVAPADAAFVAAIKSLAFSLEDLAIDFIGRQYPEIPGFDRSPLSSPSSNISQFRVDTKLLLLGHH
ncbi:hypothetical protein M422DRAFT_273206 [Sphaerobolus stellatus SS14]|uniref:Uncharacterized protein n=1 Tax=Sphaerobolus stellatus (strain SS14) TaxID=990650 RepID=A0A0C9UKL9_SPHS4|nr:hypothetical protein M422DRAFT_273206 [Sphaerobolus stellatus SS14]